MRNSDGDEAGLMHGGYYKRKMEREEWGKEAVVRNRQRAVSRWDVMFNLKKRSTVNSKRQVGVSELTLAIKQKRFVVLTIGGKRRPKAAIFIDYRLRDNSQLPASLTPLVSVRKGNPFPVLRGGKSPLRTRNPVRSSHVLPRSSRDIAPLDCSPDHISSKQILVSSPTPPPRKSSVQIVTVHPIMRRLRSQALNISNSSDPHSSRERISPLSSVEESPVSRAGNRLHGRRVSEAEMPIRKGLYGA